MKLKDYMVLGWDQLRRRKVVTALCALGIAIGSASIIVALSFGESITHYAEEQLNSFLKMDEIMVNGLPPEQARGDKQGQGVLSKQKLDMIRTLPHVKTAAIFQRMDHMEFRVDETKMGGLQIMEADLDKLTEFGYEFQQGQVSDQENTIIVNYNTTLDLYDERLARIQSMQGKDPNARFSQKPISYPLYQKQLILRKIQYDNNGLPGKTFEFPVRVVGVLKKPEGASDNSLRGNQMGYISPKLAQRMKEAFRTTPGMQLPQNNQELKIRVDDPSNVATVEKLIQKLKLDTQSNIHYQERTNSQFFIVRLIFGGAGLFILCVASISIIVAMTMSTYQRRRQIGIMKVLGANLSQIRNMFIVESALLGVMGGAIGILFSYWVIWGINIVVQKFAQSDEILFISLWILPVGMFFALLTGVLSGIYPAIKASRTDALTAIKRE